MIPTESPSAGQRAVNVYVEFECSQIEPSDACTGSRDDDLSQDTTRAMSLVGGDGGAGSSLPAALLHRIKLSSRCFDVLPGVPNPIGKSGQRFQHRPPSVR
jgi:hypothetical protein